MSLCLEFYTVYICADWSRCSLSTVSVNACGHHNILCYFFKGRQVRQPGFSLDSKSAVLNSYFWAGTPTLQENLTKLHSGTFFSQKVSLRLLFENPSENPDNFCDFQFAFLGDKTFPKGVDSWKKEFAPRGPNSYKCLTLLKRERKIKMTKLIPWKWMHSLWKR